ncbi:hypothetical protein ACHWQZ_G001069 [Mnemiopsis leidyi]
MEPIADVPLKDVGKWAEKNLQPERVGRQLTMWAKAYDKKYITNKSTIRPFFHITALLVGTGFLMNYKHQVPWREHH